MELSYLANGDAEEAQRIVGMPFLETIDSPDISAIKSLRQLAASKPETFVEVMSHDSVRGGISNELAPVVATLYGVAQNNPGLIDVLLGGSKDSLEVRTITLPLAGEVVLSIIRTGPGAARTIDLLEHAVQGVEEFMGLALPTNYVGLLFADAVSGSNAGANFGTHIAILPKYDTDEDGHEAEFAGSIIAHEVAHYYWGGNEDWVNEGAADFMASVIDGARTGRPIAVTNAPCGHTGSLAELENLGISKGDIEFRCNYSLGERLFVDLYRTLGHERFQQGFRALYLASEIEDEDETFPERRWASNISGRPFAPTTDWRASSSPAGTTGPNPTTSPVSIRARWPPTYLASTGLSKRPMSLRAWTALRSTPFQH